MRHRYEKSRDKLPDCSWKESLPIIMSHNISSCCNSPTTCLALVICTKRAAEVLPRRVPTTLDNHRAAWLLQIRSVQLYRRCGTVTNQDYPFRCARTVSTPVTSDASDSHGDDVRSTSVGKIRRVFWRPLDSNTSATGRAGTNNQRHFRTSGVQYIHENSVNRNGN